MCKIGTSQIIALSLKRIALLIGGLNLLGSSSFGFKIEIFTKWSRRLGKVARWRDGVRLL